MAPDQCDELNMARTHVNEMSVEIAMVKAQVYMSKSIC